MYRLLLLRTIRTNPVEVICPDIAEDDSIDYPKRNAEPHGVANPPPRAGRVLRSLA